MERDLRAACAALSQFGGMSHELIAQKLNRSTRWVRKWSKENRFEDGERSGRPTTALTPTNLRKLRECKGKPDQSVRILASRLDIGKSSSSRGFLKQGLKSFKRPKQSKLTQRHMDIRYETAEKFKDKPPEWWENVLSTDEKLWTVNGMINPQNSRVRAKSTEEVPPLNMDKFPGKRMSWCGVSAKGHTGIKWLTGTIDGAKYQNAVLQKVIVDDVLKRKGFDKPIDERKLFDSNARMIFEDDFAPCHKTNANQIFKEENFPAFTPVLHRFRGVDPLYFGPKFRFLVGGTLLGYPLSNCLP